MPVVMPGMLSNTLTGRSGPAVLGWMARAYRVDRWGEVGEDIYSYAMCSG